MPKKKRPLPEPPGGPFGRRRPFSETTGAPGIADRLAAAMMQGRAEEFMEEEFGDVPRAKELAQMMLGATGLMPAAAMSKTGEKSSGIKSSAKTRKRKSKQSPEAPEEVMKAAARGDVETLGNLLANELKKRSGGSEAPQKEGAEETCFDKTDIDTLLEIAAKNNVSVDWVMARAIKLYARDYRTTGRI